MGSAVKHGLPDSFPAFNFLGPIAPIKSQQPGRRLRAPARDDVAQEQFGLLIGQSRCHVPLGFQFQKRHDRAQDPCATQSFQFSIEALEYIRVDSDSPGDTAHGGLFGHVLAGRNGPLSNGELLCRPRSSVKLPIPGFRASRAIPNRVRHPEECRAIRMLEVPMIARDAHRAVPVKT